MSSTILRTERDVPPALVAFVTRLSRQVRPAELWLFGSRARGDATSDSDWDLLAVVDDAAPAVSTDPVFAWEIAREAGVPITLLVTRKSDLAEIWRQPNTIGWDLAREGVKLRVD